MRFHSSTVRPPRSAPADPSRFDACSWWVFIPSGYPASGTSTDPLPRRSWRSRYTWALLHQQQVVAVGIAQAGHPQVVVLGAVHDMRFVQELDAERGEP